MRDHLKIIQGLYQSNSEGQYYLLLAKVELARYNGEDFKSPKTFLSVGQKGSVRAMPL